MESRISTQIKLIVFSSLFTALIILGAYVAIPIGPVPIVLANFFLFLAALLLGSRWGTLSVIIYLLLGLAGLPVFSQGRAGLLHLFGPTGGYLISYIPAVFLAGLISEKGKPSIARDAAALVVAAITIYAIGVPWLKFQAHMAWDKAILAGMIPFLVGDGIKLVAALLLAQFARPLLTNFVQTKGADAQDQ